MSRHTARILFLFCVAATANRPVRSEPPATSASITELQAALGDQFRVHNTEHFSILYDTPYETLRPLTARLEGIYDAIDRFCSTLDFPVAPFSSRLVILIFARYEDFFNYAQQVGLGEGVAGFYNPRNNVAVFVDVLDSPSLRPLHLELTRLDAMLQEQNGPFAVRQRRDEMINRVMALRAQRNTLVESFNRLVLQHEAAHQVLFNRGVHVRGARTPLWLAEGLACQFEVPQADAQGSLKRVNQLRLGDLREALGAGRNGQDAGILWERAVESRKMSELRELITSDQFEGDNSQLMARYAQSWALVYYLHQNRPRVFHKYLARIASRKQGEEYAHQMELKDFEDLFGPVDKDFAADWITYMLRLRYDVSGR